MNREKIGRPTKYRPEMESTLMGLGRQGKGIHRMCVEIGICSSTWYNWCDKNHTSFQPDFLDIATRAMELSKAWWEDMAQECLHDTVDVKDVHKRLNARILEINLMNRLGYNKKTEEQGNPVKINISKELADDVG